MRLNSIFAVSVILFSTTSSQSIGLPSIANLTTLTANATNTTNQVLGTNRLSTNESAFTPNSSTVLDIDTDPANVSRQVANETNSVTDTSLRFNVSSIPTNVTLTTKCFHDLGCITSDGFFDTLKTLVLAFTDPQDLNLTFNLFTRDNRNDRQVFHYRARDSSIRNSMFRPNRRTKFIIHGYMSGFKDTNWMSKTKDYLLRHGDYNVFAIDWSKGAASLNYFQSAADTRVVGAMIAHFIRRLVNSTQTSANKMHCIGHSLGAHVCGFAGQRHNVTKLAQISGLDPAGPGFLLNDSNTRIDPSDASLVTILHTNAGIFTSEGTIPIEVTGILGNNDHLGHFDFWPNGGTKQPGCGIVDNLANITQSVQEALKVPGCNHERAHTYPRSLRHMTGCQFVGYKCSSYAEFEEGKCAHCGPEHNGCKPMDFEFDYWDNMNKTLMLSPNVSRDISNDYYLKTNETEPYCLFHYQVHVQISSNSSEKASGEMQISISNNKNVTIGRSLTASETGQDLGFKAGQNYTALYIDGKELEVSHNLTLKWTSLLRNTIKIDKISLNFMSHISKRIREKKSRKYCPNVNTSLSNGDTLGFRFCRTGRSLDVDDEER